jgi:hypothetical protein
MVAAVLRPNPAGPAVSVVQDNPIHWLRPYARALGFDGTILHGFAGMARVFAGLERSLFGGAIDRMRVLDVRFMRPLDLPQDVGLYLKGDSVFLGRSAEPAYLTGSWSGTPSRDEERAGL